MLNKLNTNVLILILVLLSGVVLFRTLFNNDKTASTLPTAIMEVDSVAINRIVIDQVGEDPIYELIKEGAEWKLKLDNGKLVPVENRVLKTALQGLLKAKPKKVVTRKEENYTVYEVTEELGSKLTLYHSDKALGSLIIGKLDFDQKLKTMYNYVRHTDQNNVYLADAPLSFDWNKKPGDWRNKTILQTSISTISKVEATGELNFSLVKNDQGTWIAQGIELDSTAIPSYITNLTNITSTEFNDDVLAAILGEPVLTITVFTEKDNYNLMVYNSPTGKMLVSSANPANVFNLSQKIAEKIYPKVASDVLEE